MKFPQPVDVAAAVAGLGFLPNRTPRNEGSDSTWVATLADYRDGGIYVVHWAGQSEWERHPADEVVMVLEGRTTMTLILDGEEREHELGPMQMVIVPGQTWHSFATPDGVKLMTISPQPSDHRIEHPSASI